MALSEFETERIKRLFSAFCDRRVAPQFRTKIRVEYRIRGDEVTLYESRPGYNDPSRWYSTSIARFKKEPATNLWSLYWADRSDKWHRYEPAPSHADIDTLLTEVDRDPTGIFWG